MEEAFGGGPLLHLPMNMPVSAALLLIAWLMLSASTCMHMGTPAADTRMRVSLALGRQAERRGQKRLVRHPAVAEAEGEIVEGGFRRGDAGRGADEE